ncbi:hypothetical protein M8818_007860 [Zalaria obscura]|uniref:Uncharacterized protein n=1 Tax=Zalaria obscura TaxID=2024903 RepID=A0ACC3S2Z5_9PEZI
MPQLVGKEVGPIGFGLMGLTWRPTPPTQEQAFEAMRAAIKHGYADKVVISIKGGANPKTHQTDASPENTRRSLNDSIAQLKGRKMIDLFEFGRRDPNVPLDTTFGLIDREYVQTGKIGGISLSEVRAETIHEAVKHTKVLAVEVELSLFSTDVLENGVATACAKALSRRPGMPAIIPIPGATTVDRMEENSKLIDITDAEMEQIDAILSKFQPAGERYPPIIPTDT